MYQKLISKEECPNCLTPVKLTDTQAKDKLFEDLFLFGECVLEYPIK